MVFGIDAAEKINLKSENFWNQSINENGNNNFLVNR